MERRTANRPTLVALGLWAVLLLSPGALLAQESPEVERAQRLFDAARELMKQQRYAEACENFSESQALDPGGGTILNLGICRRYEGRTATALKVLNEALAQARADGRSDRVATAERILTELGPELSYVKIELWRGAPEHAVTVELDGLSFDQTQLGQALALDPEHTA